MLISMRSLTLFGLAFGLLWLNQCQCNDEGSCQHDAQCTAPAKCMAQRCQVPTSEPLMDASHEASSEAVVPELTNETNEALSEKIQESTSEATETSTEKPPESANERPIEPPTEINLEPRAERPPPVCTNGAQRPCYTGPIQTQRVGACRDGTETCEDGQWGACANERQPQPEKCDGQDNDCDGRTDEKPPEEGQLCNTSLPGVCASGKLGCVKGKLECLPYKQNNEICDQLDNDCDGKVDEGC